MEEFAVTEFANSFAWQFDRDLRSCIGYDDFDSFADFVGGKFIEMFIYVEVADLFCHFDPAILRFVPLRSALPPPGFSPLLVSAPTTHESANFVYIVCTIGVVCNAVWPTKRKSLAHATWAHRLRHFASSLVLSNQCFWCMSVFKSRLCAVQHVLRVIDIGTCVLDRQHFARGVVEPSNFNCP